MSIQGNILTPRHRWRTFHIGKLVVLFVSLLCTCLSTAVFSPSAFAASTGPTPPLKHAAFTLDGVTVNIATPFLPGRFTTSKPGDAIQTATAGTPGFNVHPYGAIYVTAVPFGTKPRTESVPIAQAGSAPIYRMSLHQYRAREGDNPQPGPIITLLGQQVTGEASLMLGDVKLAFSSTVVIEWVVEAGKRIWIVRLTQEQPLGTINLKPATSLLASLSYLKLTSNTLSHATTVRASGMKNNAVPANYPLAPWWNGPCSNNPNYTGNIGTPSGTSSQANWHGIDACYDPTSVPDANITINVNGNSMGNVSEWECVELVERFFLVAGLLSHTYGANGVNIVSAYPASNMDKVTNGTVGRAPQAGDVMSYNNPDNANGHTALVTGSNVNGSGNGTITILQQNSYINGNPLPTDTLTVSNWNVVNDWNATITGWLDPIQAPPPPPPSNSAVSMALDVNNDLEAVAVGNDGKIYNSVQTAPNSTTWTGWQVVQGSSNISGTPFLAKNQDGTLTTLVRGGSGDIFANPQISPTNLNWSGFTNLHVGMPFKSDPTAALDVNGDLEMVAVDSNGSIQYNVQTAPNSTTWTGWQQVTGSSSIPGTPFLAKNQDGTLTIIVRGGSGDIFENPQVSPTNLSWSGFTNLAVGMAFKSDPTVALDLNGKLEIVAVDANGVIQYNVQTAPNSTTWTGWQVVQGSSNIPGIPILAKNQDGTLTILTRGDIGDIFEDPQTSPTNLNWSGWTDLTPGFPFQRDPALASSQNGILAIFAYATNGSYYYSFQTAANSITWNSWQVH